MTSGIIEILIENSALTTAVGSQSGHVKIFPSQSVPQNIRLPYITVSETGLNPQLAKGCPPDLDRPRYEVMCFSRDFRQTETLQQLVRDAVDTGGGFTTDVGANFSQIYMIDRRDGFVPAQGEEDGIYVKVGLYECMVSV